MGCGLVASCEPLGWDSAVRARHAWPGDLSSTYEVETRPP